MDEQNNIEKTEVTNKNNSFNIPLAIIVAGIIIAGAIFYTSGDKSNLNANVATKTPSLENIRKISKNDYIKGDINAKVKIVEYSDLECPYCKRFSATMNRIIEEYGSDKRVAHIFRHFPLEGLHMKAKTEAVSAECVAEQKGNDGFWKFIERVYEITSSNDGLDINKLPEIAEYAGADKDKFINCMNDAKYLDKVEKDIQNAEDIGGSGTPFVILISPSGKKTDISGAQPYEVVKQMIESALNEK